MDTHDFWVVKSNNKHMHRNYNSTNHTIQLYICDLTTTRDSGVAWDLVCAPFAHGGLGFYKLKHMNLCLLVKHLSKLHDSGTTEPTSYFISHYGWTPARDLGNCSSRITPVWRDIFKGLDFFRSITRVSVGKGSTTSFWYDLWLPNGNISLSQQF